MKIEIPSPTIPKRLQEEWSGQATLKDKLQPPTPAKPMWVAIERPTKVKPELEPVRVEPTKPESAEQKAPGRPVTEYLKMPIFASMKQCEAVAHIPFETQKEAKDAGCAAFHNSNRVALEPLLAWIFSDEREEGEQPKKVYEHYHGLREKLKFEREHEQTLLKAEVSTAVYKAMGVLFSTLDKMSDQLPGVLFGMGAPEIKSSLADYNETLKAQLRAAFETLVSPPKAKAQKKAATKAK